MSSDLEWLRAQLVEDADVLATVAERLAVTQNPVKRELARAGEAVGRLKLNGWAVGYSPLSRLLEIEMLLAGIDAKRSLWRALDAAALPELHDVDLERLAGRASEQRERSVPHHERAATTAFGHGASQRAAEADSHRRTRGHGQGCDLPAIGYALHHDRPVRITVERAP